MNPNGADQMTRSDRWIEMEPSNATDAALVAMWTRKVAEYGTGADRWFTLGDLLRLSSLGVR